MAPRASTRHVANRSTQPPYRKNAMHYVFQAYVLNKDGGTDTKWVIAEKSIQVTRYLRHLGFNVILEIPHRVKVPKHSAGIDYDCRKRN